LGEIEKRRSQNEKKFSRWEELPGSGRKYWDEVAGKFGFNASYVKEVNESEETVRFYQETYDDGGNLIEVHKKFPEDLGHRRLKGRRT
jgi:hypothetical protein